MDTSPTPHPDATTPVETVGVVLGKLSNRVERAGVLQELTRRLMEQLLVVGESEVTVSALPARHRPMMHCRRVWPAGWT